MAMFLSGISEIMIQRIGRWETNVFLEYIRKQVESFTCGVSNKMLQCKQYIHIDMQMEKTEPLTNKNDQTCNRNGYSLWIPHSIKISDQVLNSENCTEETYKNIRGNGGGKQNLV